MGNRVGSSPTDRMQRKGCRPVIRAFELIDRAASFFGNERSKYHGGDFRLQMAEKRYGAGGNRRGKRGNLPERRAAGMGHLQHGKMGKPGCAETEKAI